MTDERRESINTLFTIDGSCIKDTEEYFDDNGDSIYYHAIEQVFSEYHSDSDIVKIHYAEEYADQTKGNYDAATLFNRSN